MIRDDDFYAARDKAAAEAKLSGDSEERFVALVEGGRFLDAFKVLQTTTTKDSAAHMWNRLATFAMIVGDINEAKKAVCTANTLTPQPSLPEWADSVACP